MTSVTETQNVRLKCISELKEVVDKFIRGTDTSNITKCLETALGCYENVSVIIP